MTSILLATALVVPDSTMEEQDSQKHKVKVRQYIMEQCWYSPGKGSHELGNVVEVTRDSPPTRHKQEALLLFSSGRTVIGQNCDRLSPPDSAVAIGFPDSFFLSVCIVVDQCGENSYCQNGYCERQSQIVGMVGEI